MFTIKRFLLLLVIAGLAYCFWPRKSSLVNFQPAEMAALELEAAKQSGIKNWFGHGVTSYRIFSGQYNFPPFASVKAAIDRTRAVSVFRTAADQGDKDAAASPLADAYAGMRKQVSGQFNPAEVATQEVLFWTLVESGSQEEAIKVLAGELAMVYGGSAKKYLAPARDFFAARMAAKSSQWNTAGPAFQKAWSGLQTAAR